MTQNEKDLMLKDLCARLPYGVKGLVTFNGNPSTPKIQEDRTIDGKLYDRFAKFQESWYDNVTIKPYLFPLSSMTEEQNIEYGNLCERYCPASIYSMEIIDWLNKNHFDYRGLIEKGLAIDATDKNIY